MPSKRLMPKSELDALREIATDRRNEWWGTLSALLRHIDCLQETVDRQEKILAQRKDVVVPLRPKRFGCHVEIECMPDDFEPDGCVIDQGDASKCIYAKGLKDKTHCQYWREWTPEGLAEMRKKWKEEQ